MDQEARIGPFRSPPRFSRWWTPAWEARLGLTFPGTARISWVLFTSRSRSLSTLRTFSKPSRAPSSSVGWGTTHFLKISSRIVVRKLDETWAHCKAKVCTSQLVEVRGRADGGVRQAFPISSGAKHNSIPPQEEANTPYLCLLPKENPLMNSENECVLERIQLTFLSSCAPSTSPWVAAPIA